MMLSQLAPLREPPAVDWWPLAPGWWLVITMIVVALTALALWLRQRHRQRLYRHLALAALSELKAQQASSDAINRLLKAAALRAYPQARVAALHGALWLQFLRSTCKTLDPDAFAELEQPYQRDPAASSEALFLAAEKWILGHEVQHA